jgi:L-asparaginase / beta-aspartyl-peptidase
MRDGWMTRTGASRMRDGATWAVIVHGGCKPIKPSQAAANRAGMRKALAAAVRLVQGQGAALDAVEVAIRVLEDDPTFNAGTGSVVNEDGEIETDAAIMDGETLNIGGVCAARDLINPIRVARAMLEEKETLIAAEGALRFAREHGLRDTIGKLTPGEGAGTTTVGCVVLDSQGRIAAGTSTGGLHGARAGRVGDSPLPGCGVYADSQSGGVSATGDGESISRTLLAARTMLAMEVGASPEEAVETALTRMARVGGDAGLIAIDGAGRIGWKHNGTQFAIGWASNREPGLHIELANMSEAREDG